MVCKKHFVNHKLLTELTVHAETHSQPESLSVHKAHSLDELTSVVSSITLPLFITSTRKKEEKKT